MASAAAAAVVAAPVGVGPAPGVVEGGGVRRVMACDRVAPSGRLPGER